MGKFRIDGDTVVIFDEKGKQETISLQKEKELRESYISKKKNMHEVAGLLDMDYKKFLFIKRNLGITRKSSPLSLVEMITLDTAGASDDEILETSIMKHHAKLERDFYKKKDKLTADTLKMVLQDREYHKEISKKLMGQDRFVLNELEDIDTIEMDKSSGGTLVIPINDWHYGMVIDTPANREDTKTIQLGVKEVALKAISLIKRDNPEEVVILNLGDMIHGIIHGSTRFESEIDVIDQAHQVTELLALLINTIDQSCTQKVTYGDVWGNHGRVTPDKKMHRAGENFERLISLFLVDMIDAEYNNNPISIDVKSIKTLNGTISYTHSIGRNLESDGNKISALTRERPHVVLAAHLHKAMTMKDLGGLSVIVSPPLSGSDSYAQGLRYGGNGRQLFILLRDGEVEEQVFLNL